MDMNEKLGELLDFALSRRNFVRGSVATVGAVALSSSFALGHAFAQSLTDTDILQFALTLEYLEANMYQQMLAKNILTGKELSYFQNFGAAEAAHVKAIQDTLTKLSVTPGTAKSTYNFPAFNNRGDILNFAKIAEDIGVGAYTGAAAAIKNKDILAAAGSIVQVEARHAAIMNELINPSANPVPVAVTPGMSVADVTAKVKPILGS